MNKSTIKYIAKRVLMAVVTLLLIILLLFALLKLMPGSPFDVEKLNPSVIAQLEAKYGLNKPVFEQFFNYLKGMITGDFGISLKIAKGMEVSSLVGPRIGISFAIGLAAAGFGALIGVALGIVAALHKNTFWDTFATIIAVIGVSIPSFVFALVLLLIFGVKLNILPILYNINDPIRSAILPTLALSVGAIANVARFTRTEMIEVMKSDYILLAEAKGLDRKTVIFKHAIRNTLIPVITVLAPIIINLMTGSMVIEKICSIPGLGSLLVGAIQGNDCYVVMAVAFLYSLLYVIMMLVVDILYGIIDPRIRVSKED
jgi:ABC-type dipeptide/oligopeptide/nickel transport systems, permease components